MSKTIYTSAPRRTGKSWFTEEMKWRIEAVMDRERVAEFGPITGGPITGGAVGRTPMTAFHDMYLTRPYEGEHYAVGGALTMGELRRAVEMTKDFKMSKPDSGWILTSLRWLEENSPRHLSGKRATAPGRDRLLDALREMMYGDADERYSDLTGLMGTAQELREHMVDSWGEDKHRLMVSYLKNGAYDGRCRELGRAVPEVIKLEGNEGLETLDIELVPDSSAKPEATRGGGGDDDGVTLDEAVVLGNNHEAGSW